MLGNVVLQVRQVVDERTYVHTQISPASEWIVNHGLGRYVSVTILDTAGTRIYGEEIYDPGNLDRVVIRFSAPFSGKASCT